MRNMIISFRCSFWSSWYEETWFKLGSKQTCLAAKSEFNCGNSIWDFIILYVTLICYKGNLLLEAGLNEDVTRILLTILPTYSVI